MKLLGKRVVGARTEKRMDRLSGKKRKKRKPKSGSKKKKKKTKRKK